jgi:hypothetical protein
MKWSDEKKMKAMHVTAIDSSIYRGYRRWRLAKMNKIRSLVLPFSLASKPIDFQEKQKSLLNFHSNPQRGIVKASLPETQQIPAP